MNYYQNYINGKWVSGHDQTFRSIINPATNELLGQAVVSSRQDAEDAIAAANRSFYDTCSWRNMQPGKRVVLLQKIMHEIREKRDHIATLEAQNQGKPLHQAMEEVNTAIQIFREAALCAAAPAENNSSTQRLYLGYVSSGSIYEPAGVCGGIASWTTPFLSAVRMIAPALAAGNSVIFKPSSLTPVTAVKLFEIFHKCRLPRGCVNLILGPGETAGRHLAQSPEVDLISFIGSVGAGKSIAWSAIKNLKKTNMDLGGNSPTIIFANADLELAVDCVIDNAFYNQGNSLWGLPRVLVQQSLHDAFTEELVKRTSALTIGDPMKNPDIGPIVSKSHMERLLADFKDAEKQGAICLAGGKQYIAGDCARGYFIRPTIFDNCTNTINLITEGSFGPVLTIETFRTEKEAIELANQTKYGMSGSIFTENRQLALRVANGLRVSSIGLNCYGNQESLPQCAIGKGWKMSSHSICYESLDPEKYTAVKRISTN